MKILKILIDLIYPPTCISCKKPTHDHGTLCTDCWNEIDFISSPNCTICSTPMPHSSASPLICGTCLNSPPNYHRARSLFSYDENSKRIITRLKYYDKTHIAKHVSQWLYNRQQDFICESELIIPVPLHKKRLNSRKFNQSTLIAKHLSKKTNIPFIADALIRTKNSTPQTNLTFKQRTKNLNNCFIQNPKRNIQNKRVLLVDDVITTGTTVYQCTKTLLKAGAKEVNVLTVAKTCK